MKDSTKISQKMKILKHFLWKKSLRNGCKKKMYHKNTPAKSKKGALDSAQNLSLSANLGQIWLNLAKNLRKMPTNLHLKVARGAS